MDTWTARWIVKKARSKLLSLFLPSQAECRLTPRPCLTVEIIRCDCSCPSELYTDPMVVLEETGWVSYLEGLGLTYDFLRENSQTLLDLVCEMGYQGEMLTSSAPWDPLFWPVHPAAERVVQYRRLLARLSPTSSPFDETWTPYPYTSIVCDWTDVESGKATLPTCVQDGVCEGHGADDDVAFTSDYFPKDTLTNAEYYLYTDVLNEGLPYIYDNYEWPTCVESGVTIGLTALEHEKPLSSLESFLYHP